MHSKFCQLHNTLGLCLSQSKFPPTEFSLNLKDRTIVSPCLVDSTPGHWFCLC